MVSSVILPCHSPAASPTPHSYWFLPLLFSLTCSSEGTGPTAKQKYSFAFRCHRDGAMIYAVNSIDVHPNAAHAASFVTAGADGSYSIWDKDKRTRYKEAKLGATPITSVLWNPAGDLMAYAKGYDWSKGAEGYDLNAHPTKVFVHTTAAADLTLPPK
jgi:WD40 repeat protein